MTRSRRFTTFPDLLFVVVIVAATWTMLFLPPSVWSEELLSALAIPFVLFLPGYAIVSALFPADETRREPSSDRRSVDVPERLLFSVGLSLAVSPLVALLLNFTPFGVRPTPVLVVLGGLTVVASVVAARRRFELPAAERFAPRLVVAPLGRFVRSPLTDKFLTVLVVCAVLVSMGTVGFLGTTQATGEQFTEVSLLTQTADGELYAGGYPSTIVVGNSKTLFVGLENREQRTVTYTVVVVLQRVEDDVAVETTEIGRFEPTLESGQTWHQGHRIRPMELGQNFRLAYLVYTDTPPATPTVENADYDVHLWFDVVEPYGP